MHPAPTPQCLCGLEAQRGRGVNRGNASCRFRVCVCVCVLSYKGINSAHLMTRFKHQNNCGMCDVKIIQAPSCFLIPSAFKRLEKQEVNQSSRCANTMHISCYVLHVLLTTTLKYHDLFVSCSHAWITYNKTHFLWRHHPFTTSSSINGSYSFRNVLQRMNLPLTWSSRWWKVEKNISALTN